MNFWCGFVAGSIFQATIGTVIAMNIDRAWPEAKMGGVLIALGAITVMFGLLSIHLRKSRG
jgi:hypothetical protein